MLGGSKDVRANEKKSLPSYDQVQECQHLGSADVFINTVNHNITLRQKSLYETLHQHEFYCVSKGIGTHSIILIPIDLKHLQAYKKPTYMRMDRTRYQNTQPLLQENDQHANAHIYKNLEEVARQFGKSRPPGNEQSPQSDENKTGVYVKHACLLPKKQVDKFNSTSSEDVHNQHTDKSDSPYLKIENVGEYLAQQKSSFIPPQNSSTNSDESLHSENDYASIKSSSNGTTYESIVDDTVNDHKKVRSLLTRITATLIPCYKTR